MGFLDFLFGNSDQQGSQNILTNDQNSALSNFLNNGIDKSPLYGSGQNYLQNILGGGQGAYDAFEGPLMQQFQQQILPQIAERFAGMGTGAGAGGSSALFNSLGQAGTNLGTQLGALRGGLQMQALPQALNYAQQPYSNTLGGLGVRAQIPTYQQGDQGLLGNLFGGIGQAFAQPFGTGLGNIASGGLSTLINNVRNRPQSNSMGGQQFNGIGRY